MGYYFLGKNMSFHSSFTLKSHFSIKKKKTQIKTNNKVSIFTCPYSTWSVWSLFPDLLPCKSTRRIFQIIPKSGTLDVELKSSMSCKKCQVSISTPSYSTNLALKCSINDKVLLFQTNFHAKVPEDFFGKFRKVGQWM